jgi:hypothetical protein
VVGSLDLPLIIRAMAADEPTVPQNNETVPVFS